MTDIITKMSPNSTDQELYRIILNHTYQLIGLLDLNGRLLVVNQRALEFKGIQENDIIGKYFCDSPWWNHDKDEQDKLKDAINKASKGDFIRYITTHIDKDNKERIIDFSLTPYFDTYGNVKYIIPEGRDITDHKNAQRALTESEQRYRTLFETAADAIFIIDGEVIIDCNAHALDMFGCTKEDIQNKSPYFFSPQWQPDGRLSKEKALEKIQKAIEGEPQRFRWQYCQLDKKPFDAEVLLNRLELPEKTLLLVIVRDLSSQTLIEEKLKQSEKMETVGRLAGGVAHDFNNMLGSILGAAEVLRENSELLPESHKMVDTIIKASLRAAGLTQRLLAFARKAPMQFEPVNVHRLIEESVQILQTQSRTANIDISIKLESSCFWILADSSHLQNILINLCLNACDEMKDGDSILITTKRPGSSHLLQNDEKEPKNIIRISITDTGPGIPEEIREKIFEPFFTTKSNKDGTGLGLADVQSTVDEHNGWIGFKTTMEKGTTFNIDFPCIENTQEESVKLNHKSAFIKSNILVVDDEDLVRASIGRLLEHLGYHVILAGSGKEAIKHYKSNKKIEAAMIDLIMPGMNGLEVMKELHAINPELPVLMTSGYTEGFEVDDLIVAGASDFIMKPYKKEQLEITLNNLFGRLDKI